MPSESKSQQRIFGMVDAYKHHKFHPKNKAMMKKVKEMSSGMSAETVSHFSHTKHKGLPEKKAARGDFLKKFFEKRYQKKPGLHDSFKTNIFHARHSLNAGVPVRHSSEANWIKNQASMERTSLNEDHGKRNYGFLKKKAAFIDGFVKRARQYNVPEDEIVTYAKYAGMDKEAFWPLLAAGALEMGGALGGSMLGSGLMEGGIARAAAGTLPKFLQRSFVGKQLASAASKAKTAIPAGGTLNSKNMESSLKGSLMNQAGMMGGMAAAQPVVAPFASRLANMDKQQPQGNMIPNQMPMDYNQG